VNTVKDIYSDPFIEARNVVHRYVRADGVEIPKVAFPGKLSATPADYRYPPPRIGEQTREVLTEWLGEHETIAALEAAGVVVQHNG
ncbi:MAG: CoA transferase, partial [Novosphingobium sp.]|nr:CoA transferase [Novosphingobium sp.]